MIKYVVALAFLAMLAMTPQAAQAQSRMGNFGIGGQIGDPSGLTMKYYSPAGAAFGADAYDFLFAWDFEGDDELFVNIHAMYDRPFAEAPINFFLGPGVFAGVVERGDDSNAYLGFSGNFGLNHYFIERFEIYLQLTPRLALLPETEGDVGGGLGFRYYF